MRIAAKIAADSSLFLISLLTFFTNFERDVSKFSNFMEDYANMRAQAETPKEAAELLKGSKEQKKILSQYIKSPFDCEIERVAKGVFVLGVAEAETPEVSQECDASKAITIATNEAVTKIACAGARFLTTKNVNDSKISAIGSFVSSKAVNPMAFQCKGDTIYLVGKRCGEELDCEMEPSYLYRLQRCIEEGLVASAHYISRRGLFAALIEASAPHSLGFDITSDAELEDMEFLFGESPYFALVTVDEEQENEFVDTLFNNNVPVTLLGHVTKGECRMDELSFGNIEEYI